MGDISWLKKPDPMPPRRTLLNLNEINSTLTMQNSDADKVLKPQKRKSCLMFQERHIVQVPSEKKVKHNAPARTEFKSRTLKMVQSRLSQAPGRAIPTRRTQLPGPRGAARAGPSRIPSTPLSMSTPCDAPRSILKNIQRPPQRPLSAKKVNFDSETEEGVAPLEESTIQNFTAYDIPKPVAVTKVDVATNTEEQATTSGKDSDDDKFAMLLKKLESRIISEMGVKFMALESKLELLTKSNRPYSLAINTPPDHDMQVKKMQLFMANLDDIKEVSENVTPSISENVTPSTQEPTEIETPRSSERKNTLNLEGSAELQPASEETFPAELSVAQEDTVPAKSEPAPEELCPDVQPKIDEVLQEIPEIVVEAPRPPSPEAVSTEDRENASSPIEKSRKRRSARLQGAPSPSDPMKHVASRLRQIRKRVIPRHLQSFELSPRGKSYRKE